MLFPQYESKFEKTISKSIWEHLQKESAKLLKESNGGEVDNVVNHWRSIVEGKIPFGYSITED